jgi:hypothetical protein
LIECTRIATALSDKLRAGVLAGPLDGARIRQLCASVIERVD